MQITSSRIHVDGDIFNQQESWIRIEVQFETIRTSSSGIDHHRLSFTG